MQSVEVALPAAGGGVDRPARPIGVRPGQHQQTGQPKPQDRQQQPPRPPPGRAATAATVGRSDQPRKRAIVVKQMVTEPKHVFVYGTLRPTLATGEPRLLIEGLRQAGPATIRGRIVDLGEYPGLLEGSGVVHGDLLEIQTAAQLAALDAYEGCDPPRPLYRRAVVLAERPDGSQTPVWAYWYCQSVTTASPIPDGDYASYLDSR